MAAAISSSHRYFIQHRHRRAFAQHSNVQGRLANKQPAAVIRIEMKGVKAIAWNRQKSVEFQSYPLVPRPDIEIKIRRHTGFGRRTLLKIRQKFPSAFTTAVVKPREKIRAARRTVQFDPRQNRTGYSLAWNARAFVFHVQTEIQETVKPLHRDRVETRMEKDRTGDKIISVQAVVVHRHAWNHGQAEPPRFHGASSSRHAHG